ncbi:L-alanine-DL-glutamate epimerase-like enolase superfamily enzyme [Paucimonas lemoignei]|uniref:L-alanine-DL-glutamate epimerase-like enolase superfamily enzyme n=1 Tax=Paucimonas lemoignei TaxID=29443 RepID=A0A4R3I0Y7_PAULE|nr:enolase C-terminal domain-like protein [Paucimonas lemoignei]TCS39377.1 L-alanine-DL-glutamate epimerase-like enolase superfamily enzyme [Paucimonas lemoignei]
MKPDTPIAELTTLAYRIPTESEESDGTYAWDSTILVLVKVAAAGKVGIGYTYADRATAVLIHDKLAPCLIGKDALATNARWHDMAHVIRNLGRPGICSMAIAAVDAALWDWKAKMLDLSLASLLGMARQAIPAYGSGGFTSYSHEQLRNQMEGWVADGIGRVKMKIGRNPCADLERARAARTAIGEAAELFVDANGAYTRKQALAFSWKFAELGVTWFEEPVSSDDLEGLRLMRDRAPPGMAVTAGEYGYDLSYFRHMLGAQAVDVLQADASRCAGITGFLGVAALCEAFNVPLSSHCAPALHLPLCCAARPAIHLEYFHDHARIEGMLFDGAVTPVHGQLLPDLSRPGLGIEFKERDAECYRI